MNAAVRTTCPYCGVGCGVRVWQEASALKVAGDEAHPANRGRLCVKGSALAETVVDNTRLLHPILQQRPGSRVPPPEPRTRVTWETALHRVADGFRRIIDAHGPDAVAFYVSGQLLTEDYYVANKLMKGYIGSANIDTNSRLCMSSAVAGHKRAFGEDVVPVSYDDVEQADLVVLVGSNLAWCHPVLYQRLVAAKQARPELRVVVVDPRRTATCDIADLHLPLAPGSDVALFNGLLHYLSRQGRANEAFLTAHAGGCAEALAAAAEGGGLAGVARATGLSAETLQDFFALFAERERAVTLFSQGVNQSSAGTDKVNAIINCHLLTGRIGRPGMGPFSITGQPNAMGGREVGGLANQLAAHLELEQADHRALVRAFWRSPRIADRPGLKAVELFDAMLDGRIKAVWIMGTNPVVSLPDAERVRKALARCELVVVSEAVADTDTARCADVLLPATTWGERDGTVTNSERVISRQRPFRRAPGEARPDWWAICQIARRLGHGDAFAYGAPGEIFDEHARLTAFGNRDAGTGDDPDEAAVPRYLNLGGLAGMSPAQYDALEPVRWPVPPAGAAVQPAVVHRFSHADGRARLIPVHHCSPVNATSDDYPLVLNTGRVRDQWHTMSRTGLAPTLAEHRAEPFVDLHPHDALIAGVQAGALARVRTRWGNIVARVTASGEMKRGECFVPIHWNDVTASDARVGKLVNPVVDPVSGEPEFKHTPARVEPFPVVWHGFALTRRTVALDGVAWWTRVAGKDFQRFELAGRLLPQAPDAWARALLGAPEDADWLAYADRAHGIYRAVWVEDGRIEACLFLSRQPDLPERRWLAECFAQSRIESRLRSALLAGVPPRGSDAGPTVCACFGVGRNRIARAIEADGLDSCEAVTARLKAGGNCGSCLPEIRVLLADLVTVE